MLLAVVTTWPQSTSWGRMVVILSICCLRASNSGWYRTQVPAGASGEIGLITSAAIGSRADSNVISKVKIILAIMPVLRDDSQPPERGMRALRIERGACRFLLLSSLGMLVLMPACRASSTPREEAEEVMHAGLPLARRAMTETRDMRPFAFVLTSKGDVRRMPSAEQPPASQARVDALLRSLREGAAAGDYEAIAIFVEVSIEPPAGGGKTKAIEVMLEHRGGYCANAFFPFTRKADGSVDFAGFLAAPRPGAVFTACNE